MIAKECVGCTPAGDLIVITLDERHLDNSAAVNPSGCDVREKGGMQIQAHRNFELAESPKEVPKIEREIAPVDGELRRM